MGFDIKKIKTDVNAEVEGVWTEDLGDGLRLKVARMGNSRYNAAVMKAAKRHVNKVGDGLNLSKDEEEVKLREIFADTILLDWQGLEEDGKEVVYSRLNCVRILTEYSDMFKLVRDLALEAARYRIESIKDDTGN